MTTSKFGYRSAYFAVPGIGEIRVSDHPLNDAHPTSEISISSPTSFHDLAKAYAYAHNKYHVRKLAVLAHEPFLMEVGEALAYVERLESEKVERLAKSELIKRTEDARRAFWDEKVSTCGIEGEYKDIKFQLKMMGVRCPEEIATP
ncbi:hypothetical protein HFN89_00890 [Rhizobium laguerreae]|nr:hypothetical protein [Rhizobium laguerreae]